MENVPVPQDYKEALGGNASLGKISPPPGVSREHCIDAEVIFTPDWAEDGMGGAFIMFFEPSEEELGKLNDGALLRVTIRGNALVPHALGVW